MSLAQHSNWTKRAQCTVCVAAKEQMMIRLLRGEVCVFFRQCLDIMLMTCLPGRPGCVSFCSQLRGGNNRAFLLAKLWKRIRSSHHHPSSFIQPLAPAAFYPRYKIMHFHLSLLISVDEILRFHPSWVPKMPASPLMAFYIGHINLRLSPLRGISLYWPQSIPPFAGSAIG